MPPAVVAVIAAAFWLQGTTTPLKKSDLIRLLSTSLPAAEIADLMQRRCVSFVPSSRDKADLRALGADDQLLRRLDECARKVAPLRATAQLREAIVPVGEVARVQVDVCRGDSPAPSVRVVLLGSGRMTSGPDAERLTDARGRAVFEIPTGPATGTFPLTVAGPEGSAFAGVAPLAVTVRPAPLVAAAARTGFVSGLGQRARAGTRLTLPLVFEARDTANRPVPGLMVTLAGDHAVVEPAKAATDSSGRVVAFVTLGNRAGPAHVIARLGGLERQAPLVALPGPPASLVVRCGRADVSDGLHLGAGAEYGLAVQVLDALGNELSLDDLHVTVKDSRTVRPWVAGDGITVRALRSGRTEVVLDIAGLRRTIATEVAPADSSAATCRRSVPPG